MTRRIQWAAASVIAVALIAVLSGSASAGVLREMLGPDATFWIGACAGFTIVMLSIAVLYLWNRMLRALVEKRTQALQHELAERERMEIALNYAREQLEERVKERTAVLQASNAELNATRIQLQEANAQLLRLVSIDGLTPRQQLLAVNDRAEHLMSDQMRCWHDLIPRLCAKGVEIQQVDELEQDEIDWLRHYFMDEALAVLTRYDGRAEHYELTES